MKNGEIFYVPSLHWIDNGRFIEKGADLYIHRIQGCYYPEVTTRDHPRVVSESGELLGITTNIVYPGRRLQIIDGDIVEITSSPGNIGHPVRKVGIVSHYPDYLPDESTKPMKYR